jgi:beta-phosphoglucomutase family hydrolase
MDEALGILWDMDGVLTNTGEFHFLAWSQTLADYDIPFSRDQFTATFGMNNAQILQILMGETADQVLVTEIGDKKEERFRQAVQGHARLLPGVFEWLNRFQGWGFRQAIASSAPPANIKVLVDELGIRSFFDAVVSGADIPGKPDPAVFLNAARMIEVPPQRCVVIEDATAGVEAAKRGGMKCVAVTTTNPPEALARADIVVERLDRLGVRAFKGL